LEAPEVFCCSLDSIELRQALSLGFRFGASKVNSNFSAEFLSRPSGDLALLPPHLHHPDRCSRSPPHLQAIDQPTLLALPKSTSGRCFAQICA
jgi:hypothetical protein